MEAIRIIGRYTVNRESDCYTVFRGVPGLGYETARYPFFMYPSEEIALVIAMHAAQSLDMLADAMEAKEVRHGK